MNCDFRLTYPLFLIRKRYRQLTKDFDVSLHCCSAYHMQSHRLKQYHPSPRGLNISIMHYRHRIKLLCSQKFGFDFEFFSKIYLKIRKSVFFNRNRGQPYSHPVTDFRCINISNQIRSHDLMIADLTCIA
jgi:hypothetical protein